MQRKKTEKNKSKNETNNNVTRVILEKDAIVINNQTDGVGTIVAPGVQTCICLVLWHPNRTAVIHANGTGNEVAMVKSMVQSFSDNNIDPKEIQAHITGGRFTSQRDAFLKELLFWKAGLNSNAIAHPILSVLKKSGITLPSSPRMTKEHEDICDRVNVDIKTGQVTVEEVGLQSEDLAIIGAEIKRRGETVNAAFAKITSKNTPYQRVDADGNIFSGPYNNCSDTTVAWFPSP